MSSPSASGESGRSAGGASVARGEVAFLHLDPIGGISGDMFLAAVLDAWPDLLGGAVRSMRDAGLPADWTVERIPSKEHGMAGSRLAVSPPAAGPGRPTGRFRDIRGRLESSALPPAVRRRAIDIFSRLAEAEARIHGVEPDEVHFHEIADWDSVADIVGAAHVIEALGPVRWSVGPLPLGSGRVATEHGPMPVPAPATALLLRGFPVIDDGVAGERVTPTGAAILCSLQPSFDRPGAMTILESGFGLGSRRLPGVANMLRILAFGTRDRPAASDRIGVIRFEVDDQTPEDLAIGLGRVAAAEAVRDVCQWPVYGKKGRLLFSVQVLCRPDAIDEVARLCLNETSTIGLRWRIEQREVLERTTRTVDVAGAAVAVKEVSRPDGRRTAKAEADDVARSGRDRAARAELRRAAEAAALELPDE